MKQCFKLFMIVFFMFLITGCSVDYNLEFEDNKLTETININLNNGEYTTDNIDKMEFAAKYEAGAISKGNIQEDYKFSFKEQKDRYTGIFSYEYSPEQFNIANVVHQCYDLFNFVETSNGYSLTTSDTFICGYYSYMPVEQYNITITTNYIVNSHNADYVDGNKYVWEIIPNGEVNIKKPINISFSKNTRSDQLKEELSKNSSMVIIIILGVVLLLAGTTAIIFFIKNKQSED